MDSVGKSIITNIISSHSYSLLPYFFIPHLHLTKHDYTVDKYKSGNCAYFANKVCHGLHQKGIQGIQIPATLPPTLIQPGYPEYAHVSVLVPLETHLVLLEPAYFIIAPIFIPRDGSPVNVPVPSFEATWTYRYSEEENKILVTEDGAPLYYYLLERILNPSQSISYPVTVQNQRPPIVKFDPFRNCKVAHLSLRLDKGALEGFHEPSGWFDSLDFHELQKENTELAQFQRMCEWPGLSQDVCKALGWSATDLRKKVFAIILGSF